MMMMLLLSLFWLLIGLLIGMLTIAAKLPSVAWVHNKRLSMPGIGALAALAGGWLGTWVFGSLFGTATAVWVAVVGTMVVPWLIKRFMHYTTSNK
jgi:hypothetical protein